MKKAVFFLLALAASFVLLVFWMRGPRLESGEKTFQFTNFSPDRVYKDTITVLTWNIAYAQGSGSDGSSYSKVSREDMTARLNRMALLIDSLEADLVVLQEVDFASDRSYRIDQLAYLSRTTSLKNSAPVISWENRYVPYPYYPFSRHWGKIVSGAGVLSRFPIRASTTFFYEHPSENTFLYNWFYPYRFVQNVIVEINSTPYQVLNNHIEAFHKRTRMNQSLQLSARIAAEKTLPILLFAGDFNSLPVQETMRTGFSTDSLDNYVADSTLYFLSKVPGFVEIMPDSVYASAPSKWYTFPAKKPERRLDYIFISEKVQLLEACVIQTGELSDHLPVFARFVIASN